MSKKRLAVAEVSEEGSSKRAKSSTEPKFDGIPSEFKTCGTIDFTVLDLDFDYRYWQESHAVKIGNCSWLLRLELQKVYPKTPSSDDNYSDQEDNDDDCLDVFLICNRDSESVQWSYKTKLVFALHSRLEENGKNINVEKDFDFNFYEPKCNLNEFIMWSDLVNPVNGYLTDGHFTITVKITIEKIEGFQNSACLDFTVPNQFSDGIIKIDDVQFHINKSYLASYSPYFSRMFFGEFSESRMKAITLNDVDKEEFVDFLHVIHPSHINITANNVEYLLELGDKFQVHYVMKACEQFLIDDSYDDEIPLMFKLIWAGKYTLARLEDACVKRFTGADRFKRLRAEPDYKYLTDKTKVALFEKLLKLV